MAEQTTEPQVYCTCKWLERAAAEPSHPIEYVELTNEYRLITQYPAGRGYAPLYYCPWCGKSAPKSRVGSLFATLTSAERSRLTELTAGLTTVARVLEVLGPPDHDRPAGYVETIPGTATTPRARAFIGPSSTRTCRRRHG